MWGMRKREPALVLSLESLSTRRARRRDRGRKAAGKADGDRVADGS